MRVRLMYTLVRMRQPNMTRFFFFMLNTATQTILFPELGEFYLPAVFIRFPNILQPSQC